MTLRKSLYEQSRNLDDEWRDLPVNAAMSMGVHESQSLLWERMVALSRPFQSYLLPKLQATFPDIPSLHTQKEQGDRITAEHLYKAINKIRQPSIIRVEADEVTYTMHIILRYEIEKGLINGEITTDEVPLLWNSKMQSYLNVTPENDSQGCLQDVHWSAGAMGYFPTYSLGAMYACQIFQTAKLDLPTLDEDIAQGKFYGLKAWLIEKIHKSGSFHINGDALMVAVTGKPLDPKIYINYLRDKYTDLYKL
jgi:carboxypeptidase Taq